MFRSAICLAFLMATAFIIFACGSGSAGPGAKAASPTEAYKNLFAAVKSKDTEAIKRQVSKKTQELATMQASRSEIPIDAVYSNGFTDTTLAPELPMIRDERVKDTMGALEVWDSTKSSWEDVPFILEDGSWKIATGDIFSGAYKSPGLSRDEREKRAANVARAQTSASNPNAAANTAPPPTVIEVKPLASPAKK